MKNLIMLTLLIFGIQAQAATASVILKSVTFVGFAPPEVAGKYTTQILSNGSVELIDNKDKKTVMLKLSAAATKNLINKIKSIKVEELQGEDGPGCMDAPLKMIIANINGQDVTLKSTMNCIEKSMSSAYEVNEIMDSTESLASRLK